MLRDDEREADATVPLEVRATAVRAEPRALIAPTRGKQPRAAAGILDGVVHGNNSPKTHGFDLLVGEKHADEAGHFGVRRHVLPAVGLGANQARDAILVLEEHALQDRDLVGHALRRLEVRRKEHALRVLTEAEAHLLEALDPLGTGRAVGGDAKIDHAVLLAPAADRLDDDPLTGVDPANRFVRVADAHMGHHILDHGVQLSRQNFGNYEFAFVHVLILRSVAHPISSNPRRNHNHRVGSHSQKMPKFKHLLAMTTLKLILKNLLVTITYARLLVNTNPAISTNNTNQKT